MFNTIGLNASTSDQHRNMRQAPSVEQHNKHYSDNMAFPKKNLALRPQCGVKISTEMIIESIKKTRGNISRAADKIGCDRHTLHLRINKEPAIKQVLDSCRERFLDDLEDVTQAKALSGDTTMSMFLLKCLGRKRGYEFERDQIAESTTKGVLEFVFNKSKNPAES